MLMDNPPPHSSIMPAERAFSKAVIENILGMPFSANNRVRLLKSGQETFQEILDCIKAARRIICIEFYIFKDDDTGKKVAGLLKRKAGEGVSIYLLYDHFGSFLTSRRFWMDLRKKGVEIRASHPFRWSAPRGYLYRDHKKLLVIDGEKAFVGGFNIADEYHGYLRKRRKTWRDTGIYLEGPIASTLLNIFRKSWKTWKGGLIQWKAAHRPAHQQGVPVIPVFANSRRARSRMRRLLIYSIRNARKQILITTAYFTPGIRIQRALVRAARRGVSLKLLLPGESDVLSVFYAGRAYYTKLLKAGIEIYNYQGSVLHSKTAVFDDCWSIIGSTNLDIQSLRRNEESNVGILDTGFAKQMIDTFYSDLENSVRIDPETWARRPIYRKILEKFFYLVLKKL